MQERACLKSSRAYNPSELAGITCKAAVKEKLIFFYIKKKSYHQKLKKKMLIFFFLKNEHVPRISQ